jgi:hypothetical protein
MMCVQSLTPQQQQITHLSHSIDAIPNTCVARCILRTYHGKALLAALRADVANGS